MLEGGMQVSLGTVTTAPGLEFNNLSAEDNVFFITPSASGDDIPKNDNGFQMCFADGNQGKVAADYVNSIGIKKIGIFYKSDDAYSNGIFKQFKENLDSSIETVEAVFTAANETDFSAQITTLKDCEFNLCQSITHLLQYLWHRLKTLLLQMLFTMVVTVSTALPVSLKTLALFLKKFYAFTLWL